MNDVVVPVLVRDAQGRAVGNLKKEDFAVFDQGKPQVISGFKVQTRSTPRIGAQTAESTSSDSPLAARGGLPVAASQPNMPPEDARGLYAWNASQTGVRSVMGATSQYHRGRRFRRYRWLKLRQLLLRRVSEYNQSRSEQCHTLESRPSLRETCDSLPGHPFQRALAKLIEHQRITMRHSAVRLRNHQFIF